MSSLTRRSFLRASSGAISASLLLESSLMAVEPIQPDHVLLGCKDLDAAIAFAEKLCGYRAEIGGSHPGRGTRNALLKLGERSYLEIIAPDPDQRQLTWHQELLTLDEPLLVGWAVAVRDIDGYATRLRAKRVACVGPTPGSRTKPDGQTLKWKTLFLEDDKHGILPFHIEWAEDSAHPATTAPGGCVFNRMIRTGQVIEFPPPGPGFERKLIPNRPAQLHVFIAGRFGEFELTTKAIPSEAWSKRQP
jgi:catechol 2,3-dioxygenase-like lactoylglutathione lyase family enzyme